MNKLLQSAFLAVAFACSVVGVAHADRYDESVQTFKQAGKNGAFFEIIFFEDNRALEEFQSGHFEFGADASAVAITAGAGAGVGTSGANSGASLDSSNAGTDGAFYKGIAVFTIAKGGLMYAATISGQKFTYTPRGGN